MGRKALGPPRRCSSQLTLPPGASPLTKETTAVMFLLCQMKILLSFPFCFLPRIKCQVINLKSLLSHPLTASKIPNYITNTEPRYTETETQAGILKTKERALLKMPTFTSDCSLFQMKIYDILIPKYKLITSQRTFRPKCLATEVFFIFNLEK